MAALAFASTTSFIRFMTPLMNAPCPLRYSRLWDQRFRMDRGSQDRRRRFRVIPLAGGDTALREEGPGQHDHAPRNLRERQALAERGPGDDGGRGRLHVG